MYTLLRTAVAREPGWIDWKIVSSAIIGKSLSTPQLGSASELSDALLLLTTSRPHAWTEDYAGKTLPSKRLRQYIQKGSQGGHARFWSNLDQLLRIIPRKVLAGADKTLSDETVTVSSVITLTKAFQEGLNSREEPRQNLTVGWKSYISSGCWLATLVPDQTAELFHKRLSPLVAQYVRPDPELVLWSLPFQSGQDICADYLAMLPSHEQNQELQSLWTDLSNELLEAVKLSSPEQSKDFRVSQDSICAQSKRLFALESAVLIRVADTEYESRVRETFEKSNLILLESCLQVLRSRNGKPYGAAGVVEECVRSMPFSAKESQELLEFVQTDAPELLFSPSGDRLVAIILVCREWDGFASSFENVVERVMELEPEQSNIHVLQTLLPALDFNEIGDKAKLTTVVMSALGEACKGSRSHWSVITAVLQNQTLRSELMNDIFLAIIESLSAEEKVFDALHGLSHLGKIVPSAVQDFQGGAHGSKLTGKLLYLSESPSEQVANLAESLMENFKETVIGDIGSRSKIEILRHGLGHADEESLS